MGGADVVLIPTRPDAIYDLDSVKTTIQLARTHQRRAFVLFNLVPSRRVEACELARHAMEGLGVGVVPVILAERAAHKDAVATGMIPLEFLPKDKASKEMKALFLWSCEQVSMSPIKAKAAA